MDTQTQSGRGDADATTRKRVHVLETLQGVATITHGRTRRTLCKLDNLATVSTRVGGRAHADGSNRQKRNRTKSGA